MSELIEPDIEPKKLRPVILTCDKRLGIFKKFVDSYKQVADSMLQPIVLAQHWHEETREEYDALIQELNPHKVVEQPNYYFYDDSGNKSFYNDADHEHRPNEPRDLTLNTQEVMTTDFPRIALTYSKDNEDVIFMEDDMLFSNKFTQAIEKVSKYLSPDFSFVTLFCGMAFNYTPDMSHPECYTPIKDIPCNNFIHAIDGDHYNGNLCVVFHRSLLRNFLDNREDVKSIMEPWDIRWGQYMKRQNINIYATRKSYVQHQAGYSVIRDGQYNIQSRVFEGMLRPFILTCDVRLDMFREFIESYKTVAHTMLPPIILAGFYDPDKREEYSALIQELNPHVVIEQPNYIGDENIDINLEPIDGYLRTTDPKYFNIQKIMIKDFPEIVLEHSEEDIIFIEDDAEFSSQFPEAIEKVSKHIQSDSDIIGLYSPLTGWPTKESLPSDDFIHAVSGHGYYGTVCMVLNLKIIKAFRDNWEEMETLSTAWDVRWAIYAENNGFRIYSTRNSYVKHQQGYSAIDEQIRTDENSYTKTFVE